MIPESPDLDRSKPASPEPPPPRAAPHPVPAEQLKIVIVGHVDHGKSTLIGRLFHDTGALPEGKLEQLQLAAQRRGVPFEWANLMDALQSERDQNITIDTAQIWFRTHKRQYVLIDAPGHEEFIKNMVTGAASANAALLVIAAEEGVREQSRRHGYLLGLLGVRQIAVLVNKMDLVDYSRARFEAIASEYREFLLSLGLKPNLFIPISAKQGDNNAQRGDRLAWWNGPTVLEALDSFTPSPAPVDAPLRFAVQDVYRFDNRRILAGRVESGTLRVGERVLFTPGNKVSTVKTIERWSAPPVQQAHAGESIGITLSEQLFVERGAVGSLESDPPFELAHFKARIFWLGRQPLTKGRQYKLKLATQEADCGIETVEKIIDASSLAEVRRSEQPPTVRRHEVAELVLHTRRPVAFDVHGDFSATARFVLVDGYDVAGGGIILPNGYPCRTSDSLHKSTNIYWSSGKVTRQQRTLRNGHPGCVVWLTGLSASGKSTIAYELERQLFNRGRHVYVLDGDKVRHGLCSDLAFSPEDRKENIRRVGEMAKIIADSGAIVITAFISPYQTDRRLVRSILNEGDFIEVYVNAPVQVCEQRDPKGLYAKARAGQIKDFTGISAPYEPPEHPELELRTDQATIEESVASIVEHLEQVNRKAREITDMHR